MTSSTPLTNKLPEAPGIEDLDVRDRPRFQEVFVPGYEYVGTHRERRRDVERRHEDVGVEEDPQDTPEARNRRYVFGGAPE